MRRLVPQRMLPVLFAMALFPATGHAHAICTFTSPRWQHGFELSVGDGAKPFARATYFDPHPAAQVRLNDDRTTEAQLEAEGVLLDGELVSTDWLFARRPLRLGSVVVLGQGGTLTHLGGTAGHVTVETSAPADFKPIEPLRTTVGCDELAIEWTRVDDARAAIGLPRSTRLARLRTQVDVPVSSTIAGEPAGTLRFDDVSPDVEVVKSERGWTQIVVDRFTSFVYGWVPSGFVVKKPREKDLLGGISGGIGYGTGRGSGRPRLRRCPVELELRVRQDGQLHTVGRLAARTPFVVRAGDPELTPIRIENSWFELENGSELGVSTAALAACPE